MPSVRAGVDGGRQEQGTPSTPKDAASSNPKNDVDVTVTVLKADPIAAAPKVAAIYGQALANVALDNPAGNTPGTWHGLTALRAWAMSEIQLELRRQISR